MVQAERKAVLYIGVALIVLSLIIFATSIVSAAGQQHWKLDSEELDRVEVIYEMERVEGPGNDGQTGSVMIDPGVCQLWVADEEAEVDVTFPGGIWSVTLCTDANWHDTCDVSVGEWDGSNFTPFALVQIVDTSYHNNIITIKTQLNSETVADGNWLAMEVCNYNDTTHEIFTNGCSELVSPCEDPGYPWPEVTAGILFGIGLLGLVAYTGARRLRTKKAAV
jgi:hypothetical protein